MVSGFCVPEPANQVVDNEHIADWYTLKERHTSEYLYDFNQPVYDSFTLYARWSSSPLVTVNFTGTVLNENNKVIFRSRDGNTVYAEFVLAGSARIPADAMMEVVAGNGVVYSGSITAEIPVGNSGACYLRTTDFLNGTSVYTPDYGSHAAVDITFSNAPRLTVNALSGEYENGYGEMVEWNTDALWSLKNGENPSNILYDGDTVNVPQGEIAPVSAKLTLTMPDGFGCDGTTCFILPSVFLVTIVCNQHKRKYAIQYDVSPRASRRIAFLSKPLSTHLFCYNNQMNGGLKRPPIFSAIRIAKQNVFSYNRKKRQIGTFIRAAGTEKTIDLRGEKPCLSRS